MQKMRENPGSVTFFLFVLWRCLPTEQYAFLRLP